MMSSCVNTGGSSSCTEYGVESAESLAPVPATSPASEPCGDGGARRRRGVRARRHACAVR
eukprot:7391297-Prymnesium_polylepis.2